MLFPRIASLKRFLDIVYIIWIAVMSWTNINSCICFSCTKCCK